MEKPTQLSCTQIGLTSSWFDSSSAFQDLHKSKDNRYGQARKDALKLSKDDSRSHCTASGPRNLLQMANQYLNLPVVHGITIPISAPGAWFACLVFRPSPDRWIDTFCNPMVRERHLSEESDALRQSKRMRSFPF